MKIVFTLNQLEAYTMALSRHDHLYDVARSYCGIKKGDYYPKGNNIVELVGSVFILTKGDYDEPVFSVRGEIFDYNMVKEDAAIYEAMADVKNYLNTFHLTTLIPAAGKPSAGKLAKKVKALKSLLDNFNW